MSVVLLSALVPVIAQTAFGVSFCDDLFFGWAWLLIAPWVVTALARAWVPMARLARADRAAPG